MSRSLLGVLAVLCFGLALFVASRPPLALGTR